MAQNHLKDKRWLPGVIVVLLVVLIGGLSYWQSYKKHTEKIKVGFIGPFSGDSAVFGSMMQNGLDIALKDLPQSERDRIEIIKEDDQCQGAPGLTAATKLINIDKVKYVIGPLCNESSLSSEKLFEDNKVISLTIGLPSNDIANMGPYHFSFSPEIEYLMITIAQEMINKGHNKVAIIHMDAPFENENYKQFKKHYEGLGGQIVADESATYGTVDFRTQILKFKNANPDSLMLAAHTANLTNILKQLEVQGISTLPKYGIHAAETPDIIQNVANLAEGLVYPYPADRNEVASSKNYYDKYKAIYNFDADPYSSNVYDSLNILIDTVDKCGYNNISCVQNKFSNLKDYHGANGLLSVDNRGVGTYKSIMLKIIKNGKFEKYTQ